MELNGRLRRIENQVNLNPDLFPDVIDFDNMSEKELDEFLFTAMKETLKKIKDPVTWGDIIIKDKESFIEG